MSKQRSEYVSRTECALISTDLKTDLKILKSALIGDDMRGGMVKDIADLKLKVDAIARNHVTERIEDKEQEKEKRDVNVKWKMAALSILSAAVGAIVTHFL